MAGSHVSDPDESEPELEHWVRTQHHTFTNWVNDKLRIHDMKVENLRTDFKDGVVLCKLMEALKGKRIGRIIQKKSLNHYEASGNLQVAFDAMAKDGVRLVNIGAEDLTSGNIKLILGMMWTLIRFYQIGSQSRLPTKALMMSWCNAVLYPHIQVSNFTTDWADGLALHGLIEYCSPGSYPEWYNLSRKDHFGNCQQGMDAAQSILGIPMVMRPDDLSSYNPDELSTMTYLSYFMAEKSPGFNATLDWVRSKVNPLTVDNFDRDWNSGQVLATLVKSLGGSLNIEEDEDYKTLNDNAIKVGKSQLGVDPILSAKDLISPEVDHIGVMAHAAWYQSSLRQVEEPIAPEEVEDIPPTMDVPDFAPPPPPIVAPPPAPSTSPERRSLVNVTVVDSAIIDTTVTVGVDSSQLGSGHVTCSALSPSGDVKSLQLSKTSDSLQLLQFIPTERGRWTINVQHEGATIDEGPFYVSVYDPALSRLTRDYEVANQHDPFNFEIEVSEVGLDDVSIYVIHEGAAVDHHVTSLDVGKYHVAFTPTEKGSYTVSAYCGGAEVPGSPFDVVCKLVEGVEARGQGLSEGVVNATSEFEVDTHASPGRDLDVFVYGPNDQQIEASIKRGDGPDMRIVTFVPRQAGEHRIEVMYDGIDIRGSPFVTQIRKSRVYVHDLSPYVIVGKQSKFRIDASEMQKGTLEIDSDLPVVSYDKLGQNNYMVTFVPRSLGSHDVMIRYNDELVDGCPFAVEVRQ